MGKIYSYASMLGEDTLPYMEKLSSYEIDRRYQFSSPDRIADFVRSGLRLDRMAEEHVYVLALNSKCHLTGCAEVSHGTINISVISPREVFQKALLLGAASIVLVHNHPSGDPTPSEADISATKKLVEAGKIIEIAFFDHIVVGKDGYMSLKQAGII